MHVPDGFIDAPVSIAAGVVAAGAIGVALRGSRRELGDERVAPLAGLVAAFVFAVQMLNFPVAAGTSGHLLGGVLAAVLVGPWTGVLCVSVVLLVQLFFADGGLTAYGVNVTCMAVTTALVGWLVFRAALLLLPRRPSSVVPASFVAALVSVPAAALVFTGIYAIGGTADIPLGSLAAAMIGVHVLIGIGEAVITALVVSSVLALRPDLVYGARALVAARRAGAVGAGVAA
jgi:cobalt/nickel transport system permease protein